VRAGSVAEHRVRLASTAMCALADEAHPGSIEFVPAHYEGGLASLVARLQKSSSAFLRRHEVYLCHEYAIWTIIRDLDALSQTVLPHLGALVVAQWGAPSEDMIRIFRAVQARLPSLRVALHPEETSIMGYAPSSLPEILRSLECPFLHLVSLDGVRVDVPFVIEVVARLRALSVRVLSMSHSRIGDAGAEALTVLDSLRELELRHCGIGDRGAAALATMGALRRLKLQDNEIGAPGVAAIAPMVAAGICTL
jgi:hypothetical protein